MTKEAKALSLSMIINFFVSAMKIIAGIFCSSKTMIADGFHSISDFITDIVAIYGTKISKKNRNKNYPDGFGRVEYIIDIFIALVIFALGVITLYNSFTSNLTTPNPIWAVVIIITILLKHINSKNLLIKGEKYHSPILITSSKESKDDMISSIGVIIILLISQFENIIPILKYADTIGGVIIGLLIFKTAYDLLEENIISLVGKLEDNENIKAKIEDIVEKYPVIELNKIELEEHGSYYVLELHIYILEDFKVSRLLRIQKDLKNKIKKLHQRIKYIDVNICHISEKENPTKE